MVGAGRLSTTASRLAHLLLSVGSFLWLLAHWTSTALDDAELSGGAPALRVRSRVRTNPS